MKARGVQAIYYRSTASASVLETGRPAKLCVGADRVLYSRPRVYLESGDAVKSYLFKKRVSNNIFKEVEHVEKKAFQESVYAFTFSGHDE